MLTTCARKQKIWMSHPHIYFHKPLWHPELSRSFKFVVSKRYARWNYSEWSGTRRSNFLILKIYLHPHSRWHQSVPVISPKKSPCSICLWRLLWSVYIYIQAGHYVNWEEIQRFWNTAHSFDTTYMRTHASAHINVTGSQLVSYWGFYYWKYMHTHKHNTNVTQTQGRKKSQKFLGFSGVTARRKYGKTFGQFVWWHVLQYSNSLSHLFMRAYRHVCEWIFICNRFCKVSPKDVLYLWFWLIDVCLCLRVCAQTLHTDE